jgi:hypothetical protein
MQLGSCDASVPVTQREAYLAEVETLTRVRTAEVAAGSDKLALAPYHPDARQPLGVADVQRALKTIGFFPGAKVDGICGYRTRSAIRLFQEYVRSVERQPSVPDGAFGPSTRQHLQRWIDSRQAPDWTPLVERWRAGSPGGAEYAQWLSLLERVKARHTSNPSRTTKLVEAFGRETDTRRVAQWDFPSTVVHLVGIRRHERSRKFDDIFVLLVKGLVFKFQGSTEPGASEHPLGMPYLVPGQHDYHFGWHRKQYLALRPQHLDRGVLVVRSKSDGGFDDSDLAKGLEANASINVHWGGKGKTFDVKSWSEGCQVINGSAYINAADELVDCSSFAATNNSEAASQPSKTRGAYNVLVDLVTAFASDLPSPTVSYMLLTEEDLALDLSLEQRLADARQRAGTLLV